MKNKATEQAGKGRTGVGRSLTELRTTLGLTLKQAAEAGQTSYAYLSRVESGACIPKPSWVASYTGALGDYLHGRDQAA